MKISFVIPCYRSEKTIEPVILEIEQVMKQLDDHRYEIILVNDCSPDDTLQSLRNCAKIHKYVTVIDLAKNSGQPAAILCGFSFASGDYIVCGDDDGQSPFFMVPEMLACLLDNDYDIVCGKYINRSPRSFFREIGTYINEKMTAVIFEKNKEIYLSAFLVARRFVVDEIIKYRNSYPYLAGLILRTTRNIGNVEMEQRGRIGGVSGYSMKKLLALWFNGFTAFSVKPLRLASVCGICSSFIGFFWGLYCVILRIINDNMVSGWSSTMALISFIGGVIMLLLGMIGEYVGRIYLCMNKNPQYVIREIYQESCREDEG